MMPIRTPLPVYPASCQAASDLGEHVGARVHRHLRGHDADRRDAGLGRQRAQVGSVAVHDHAGHQVGGHRDRLRARRPSPRGRSTCRGRRRRPASRRRRPRPRRPPCRRRPPQSGRPRPRRARRTPSRRRSPSASAGEILSRRRGGGRQGHVGDGWDARSDRAVRRRRRPARPADMVTVRAVVTTAASNRRLMALFPEKEGSRCLARTSGRIGRTTRASRTDALRAP